jgi:hypothetical protein
MKKPKPSRFSGKVKDNAQKTKSSGASYGYLNLPRGLQVFNPDPDGTYKLDFMPYIVTEKRHPDGIAVGEWWYKRPFKAHRQIGGDSVVCLSSIGKKCPICEARAQMIKDGQDKKETDALKPSQRNLYIVIPVGEKKLEEKPYIFDISAAMFQNQLAEELESENIPESFPDIEQGVTLKVRFAAKTFGTSKPFPECSRIDAIDREAYDEDIMEQIPDLDSILNIMTYQELEKKFLEIEDDEDEDLDAIKKTAEEKAKQRKQRVTESEEEDDPHSPPPPRTVKKDKPKPPPEPEEDEPETCIACQGSGKNSKGGTCRICKGSGEKPLPEKGSVKQCTFGHIFGTDCEKFDSCDDCDDWDACIDAKGK